jgi:hypothetical protein
MWARRNETITVGHWIKITLFLSKQVWVFIILTWVIYGYDWSTSRPTQLTAGKKSPDLLDYEAEWSSEPVRMLKYEGNLLPCRKSKNSTHAKRFLTRCGKAVWGVERNGLKLGFREPEGNNLRLEFIMVVNMKNTAFYHVTLCGLTETYYGFGQLSCFGITRYLILYMSQLHSKEGRLANRFWHFLTLYLECRIVCRLYQRFLWSTGSFVPENTMSRCKIFVSIFKEEIICQL